MLSTAQAEVLSLRQQERNTEEKLERIRRQYLAAFRKLSNRELEEIYQQTN